MQKLKVGFINNRSGILATTAVVLIMAILFGSLSLTAFAETTYVITDGDQVTVHTTTSTDPSIVLGEAGIILSVDDIYTTEKTEDGSEIYVQRCQDVTVLYCGEEIKAQTYGETVDELLTRLGVPSYGNYKVSAEPEEMTYDGMVITVNYIQKSELVYEVEIPFETTYCYDPTLPDGEEVVLVEGVAGVAERTDSVWYLNHKEQNRATISEKVVKAPVNCRIVKGTGTEVGRDRSKPLIGDGFIVTTEGKVLTYDRSDKFLASAYTMTDEGCNDTTATGTKVRTGTVAVDPRVIPYGTEMFIVTDDGAYIYGESRAEDCGGAIIGKRVDLYFHTDAECWTFGLRDCTIYFLT